MNRRKFLAAVAAAPVVTCLESLAGASTDEAPAAAQIPVSPEWRRFEIKTRVTLPADDGTTQLWLPLAQSAGDYQSALDLRWQSNGQTQRVHDTRYGAPILRSVWAGKTEDGSAPQVDVVQTVATRDRTASALLPLTQVERQFWTTPTIDDVAPQVVRRITADQGEPRAKLRAIYDWVVDHTHRDPDVPGCGTGDYQQALRTGALGGKCADINSLLVGLARAAGFPAREVYGLRVAASRF